MDALRRSLGISRRDRIRNETIKQRMGIEGDVIQEVNIKQLTWYGHVCTTDAGIETTQQSDGMATSRDAKERKTQGGMATDST